MVFHLLATTVLVMCDWRVAAMTTAAVYAHRVILELNNEPERALDTITHTWNVAITTTWLRYMLFATQPWYNVFAISLAIAYIEAHGHRAYTRTFSIQREIFGAATDTALVSVLCRNQTLGCSVLAIAAIPLRTHILQHCTFELGMWLMAKLHPLTVFEIAGLCTWTRTRNITQVRPLFA